MNFSGFKGKDGYKMIDPSPLARCLDAVERLTAPFKTEMVPYFLIVFAVLQVLVNSVFGQDLTAALDYGTFQGSYSARYNISYWRKIPFAAPPIGVNRFRAPQPPATIVDGIYNSDQSFDMCPQRTVCSSKLLW
jgi:hypothetical protein